MFQLMQEHQNQSVKLHILQALSQEYIRFIKERKRFLAACNLKMFFKIGSAFTGSTPSLSSRDGASLCTSPHCCPRFRPPG